MFGFNVNFGGIDERFETFECMIDIETNGNKQRQRIQAPRIMIEQQFMSLVQQAVQADRPVKVILSRMVPVYDEFNDKWIEIENYIAFENNMYSS